MIIGVDFDGTIVTKAFPGIGRLRFLARPILRWAWNNGHTVVLWTCRERHHLEEAKRFMTSRAIPYDYVNENVPRLIELYDNDSRKLGCDLLVDDTAGFVFWPWVFFRILWKGGKQNRLRNKVLRQQGQVPYGRNQGCSEGQGEV